MDEEQEINHKRKPGGQPGNVNAIKHGRYARSVPAEYSPKNISSSLEEEISMLRNATRRVFELADKAGDIDQAIKVLGALGLASIRTSRLLKSQKELGDGDQALDLILAALSEFLSDWGWR
jgi:hypothetical protein